MKKHLAEHEQSFDSEDDHKEEKEFLASKERECFKQWKQLNKQQKKFDI